MDYWTMRAVEIPRNWWNAGVVVLGVPWRVCFLSYLYRQGGGCEGATGGDTCSVDRLQKRIVRRVSYNVSKLWCWMS